MTNITDICICFSYNSGNLRWGQMLSPLNETFINLFSPLLKKISYAVAKKKICWCIIKSYGRPEFSSKLSEEDKCYKSQVLLKPSSYIFLSKCSLYIFIRILIFVDSFDLSVKNPTLYNFFYQNLIWMFNMVIK